MGGAFFLIMKFHYGYEFTIPTKHQKPKLSLCFFSNVNDDLLLSYNID